MAKHSILSQNFKLQILLAASADETIKAIPPQCMLERSNPVSMRPTDCLRKLATPKASDETLTDPTGSDTLNLSIDYPYSLANQIKAGGYKWTHENITERRFLALGKGLAEVEARLFLFGKRVWAQDTVKQIALKGWQLAKIQHLLAFGIKYPNEQQRYPIVALGSVMRVEDRYGVALLDWDGTGRVLTFDWWSGLWDAGTRFLAVRDSSRLKQ